jgi:shikimate kinase
MTDSRRVILLGLRASGKSTAGPRVAAALGTGFVDLDDEVARDARAERAGDVLRQLGQAGFRERERASLERVLGLSIAECGVLALGGGTPTWKASRSLLEREREQGRAVLVYLRASAEALAERLRGTDLSQRPALIGSDPISEVQELLAQRDRLYVSLAHAVVRVDEPGVDAQGVADRVLAAMRGA